jgi:AcrR family transcriptional regulator
MAVRQAAPTRTGSHPTRRLILDAALDLFAERGFDGASTRLIAERAGVAQPLLNYHFAGKQELWQAAVDDLFERLRASTAAWLGAVGDDTDDVGTARSMVRHFVEFSAANPQLHRIIMQESKQPGPRLDWLVDTHVRPLYENATALFERLAAAGRIAPIAPAHLYYLLVGAGATVFVMAPECQRLSGVDPFEPEFVSAHADLVVDLMVRAATKEHA